LRISNACKARRASAAQSTFDPFDPIDPVLGSESDGEEGSSSVGGAAGRGLPLSRRRGRNWAARIFGTISGAMNSN
jgi:hypothetical protein